MVYYLFLPWNLPWIILACYSNQQQQKKKQSIIPRSDAVVCDIWSGRTRFGNSFIESGTDKPCWSKQKRRKKTDAFKRCILLSLSVKRPMIFLDTPTAPGCFAVSVYSHVLHKRINYQTTVIDDSCQSLVYRTKVSEVLIFWQCLDNDVINLCCGRLPLFSCLSNIHVKWPFRAF